MLHVEEYSSQNAELNPKGDIVHYVTYPEETMEKIALWYTGDKNNRGRISRLNKMGGDTLHIGDVVIIPSYLAKTKLRMTEKGLQALDQ